MKTRPVKPMIQKKKRLVRCTGCFFVRETSMPKTSKTFFRPLFNCLRPLNNFDFFGLSSFSFFTSRVSFGSFEDAPTSSAFHTQVKPESVRPSNLIFHVRLHQKDQERQNESNSQCCVTNNLGKKLQPRFCWSCSDFFQLT